MFLEVFDAIFLDLQTCLPLTFLKFLTALLVSELLYFLLLLLVFLQQLCRIYINLAIILSVLDSAFILAGFKLLLFQLVKSSFQTLNFSFMSSLELGLL